MFKEILLLTLLSLGLNSFTWSKSKTNQRNISDFDKVSFLESNIPSHQLDTVFTSNITPQEAKQFATKLLEKINYDEKLILNAYKHDDYNTINKYTLYDINDFITKPYSKVEENFFLIKKYFPFSEVMFPYLYCDTALIKLAKYAGSLGIQLSNSNDWITKEMIEEERLDFERAKFKCSQRVNMTYEEALKAHKIELYKIMVY
ncbi:hypothetical protein [Snodgrassella gandavensis]|uniref:hypothetical protein n=1 Tax=Snodgrassella gandavensis TaxID=2946698 RepID=UPI001EF6D155|nr:hypothetical protein [Snodgrassella gandavensis]